MSCSCARCMEHYRTLGIAFGVPSESALQAAYGEALKQWNPDQYEDYPSLRADAEDHLKQVQLAYRELKEHSATPGGLPVERAAKPEDAPLISRPISEPFSRPVSDSFSRPSPEPFSSPVSEPASPSISQPIAGPVSPSFSEIASPSISFGDAPGCQTAPHFTEKIEEIINRHRGKLGMALAIVDLGGARAGSYSQFLLLAAAGILVRDYRQNISLLWYRDMGEVNLIDKHKSGKSGFSNMLFGKLASGQPKYELQIFRSDGTHFFSITDPVDDHVKKVIDDFLLSQKTQVHP
jgi:hypothetical protein